MRWTSRLVESPGTSSAPDSDDHVHDRHYMHGASLQVSNGQIAEGASPVYTTADVKSMCIEMQRQWRSSKVRPR